MHACSVRSFFDNNINIFSRYESHPRKSLKKHCEEIVQDFDKLMEFYGFKDEMLRETGHYLSYYHDIGKLSEEWQKSDWGEQVRVPHSRLAANWLSKYDDFTFPPQKELTPLLMYLILRHHQTLKRPEKIKTPENFWAEICNLVSSQKYFEKILEKINLVELADVFGLFKIADSLSALSVKSKKSAEKVKNRMTKRFKCTEITVKKLIGKKIDEKKWKDQLKLRELPDIALLRAPTSWGKTSVALLFASGRPCTRVFYLLPTITAINNFYKKLCKILRNDVSKYFYFYDTEVREDEDKLQTLFFTKSFLSPCVITTVDQFLLTMLQLGKYHTRRVSFRNSVIIMDEVHLLNPMMLRLFSHFIIERNKNTGGNYKMKLLLMSATLPKAYSQFFCNIFNVDKSGILDFGAEYSNKRRVMFELGENIEDDVEKIYDQYRSGKRVLVIANTVDKAIALGRKLREEVCKPEKKNIIVFHAKFMYRDRKKKEELLERKKKRPHILVATQVCEVSLDISYDVLYTEAPSLGSLIQRFGRVNRYGNETKEVNAFVYYPVGIKNNHYPYEHWEIDRCWDVLQKFEGKKLRNEKNLLDEFDQLLTLEDLKEKINECTKNVRLEAWGEMFRDFFCVDVKEDMIKEALDYRETFTIHSLIDPSMIKNKITKKKFEKLLKETDKRLPSSYLRRLEEHAKIKEFLVPLPMWVLRKYQPEFVKGFPIFSSAEWEYDDIYGLHKIESPNVIIG